MAGVVGTGPRQDLTGAVSEGREEKVVTRPGSVSCSLALCPLGQRRGVQGQTAGQAAAGAQQPLCPKQEEDQVLSCLMKGLLPGFP